MLHKYAKVAPHLWHTDLHAGNLFIQNGRLSSVIDWQGQWIAPLVLQGCPPKLVHYDGELIFEKPENFDDLDAQEKSRIRKCIGKSMVFYLYQLRIKNRFPLLLEVFGHPYGEIRTDPITMMGNTWDNDIIRLRGRLIMVVRYSKSFLFSSGYNLFRVITDHPSDTGSQWDITSPVLFILRRKKYITA